MKYYYGDQMKMWEKGRIARMGEFRNTYGVLVRKPQRKRALGNPMHRNRYNINMYVI